MRQSRTTSKNQRNHSSTPVKQQKIIKNTGESDFYFCHFNNCMYMGGIKAFQKHGRGIMIHDDGTSVVTSYFNDFKNGHNIFYKQNCIMSIEYQKNRVVQCVLRISVYLLLIRYGKDQKPDGKATLIDYENHKIYYVLFKKGFVAQKYQQEQISIINRIFDLGNLQYLIGSAHANAIKFQIQKDQYIASQKLSTKFHAGFYKKGLLNGLGFVLLIKNQNYSDTGVNPNQFFLQIAERGYFNNGQLNAMGQKWFKNGNYYTGQFKCGVFEGKGVLKNEVKKNWVYGSFQAGQLNQLIQYSHEGDVNKLNKLILSLHERKSNWINNDIQIQPHQQFAQQIQQILMSNPTQKLKTLNQRKIQVLKKIQDNFLYDDPYENSMINNQSRQTQQSNQQNEPNKGNKSRKVGEIYKTQLAKSGYQKQHISGNSYNSRYRAQIIQPIHTTKGSSSRLKQLSTKPQASAGTQSSRTKTPQGIQYKKASKIKITQNYQDPSFALDSKRFIGRSRIFHNTNNSQSQQLPKFNYTPSE